MSEQAAMRYAVRALSRRAMSVADLRARLSAKYEIVVVDAVIARLRRERLLSDEAAADAIAHARRSRGYAAAEIEGRLRERGIDSGAARRAARAAAEGLGDEPLAFQLAVERVRRAPASLAPDAIRRRVYGWLARRGYSDDLCRDAVERAMERITRA